MKRKPRSNGVREKLLNQGVSILSEHGYHGTGLKQILDSAEVPKGSFYHYFSSKDHYGAQVLEHYTDKVVSECDAWLSRPDLDGFSALAKYLETFIEKSRQTEFREGCLLGTLGAEIGGTGDACMLMLQVSMKRVQERFEAALSRAQEEGTVRRDLSANLMADLLLTAWEGAIMRMRVSRSTEPLEEVYEFLLQKYFRDMRGDVNKKVKK